jgi:hypothetical protein
MSEKIAQTRWLRPVDGALRGLSHLAGVTDLEVPTLPGGRTDKARRTSVSELDLDGHRYLVFEWSGADWAANGRAKQMGVLAVRQREERVQFGKLLPADAVRIVRVWYVRTPQGAKAMEDGHVPDLKPDTFTTRGRRCAPFRVEAA